MNLKLWNELTRSLSNAESVRDPDDKQYYAVTMSDELLEALISLAVYMEKLNSIQSNEDR